MVIIEKIASVLFILIMLAAHIIAYRDLIKKAFWIPFLKYWGLFATAYFVGIFAWPPSKYTEGNDSMQCFGLAVTIGWIHALLACLILLGVKKIVNSIIDLFKSKTKQVATNK